MTRVAVIPARGGSKRIPRKNIRPFAGKPIIGYAIEAARTCGLFERVLVSTDDREIAAVAESFGAEVPFIRPVELADDFSGTNAVVRHALQWLDGEGAPADFACCIYATAPFLRVDDLCRGFHHLVENGSSYAFSVTTFPFPIQRALRINAEGCLEAIWPENNQVRSQDLEEAYHDAAQFYWGSSQAFIADRPLFSPESVPVILPRHRVQDIDTEEDWLRAELMYQALAECEEGV